MLYTKGTMPYHHLWLNKDKDKDLFTHVVINNVLFSNTIVLMFNQLIDIYLGYSIFSDSSINVIYTLIVD